MPFLNFISTKLSVVLLDSQIIVNQPQSTAVYGFKLQKSFVMTYSQSIICSSKSNSDMQYSYVYNSMYPLYHKYK